MTTRTAVPETDSDDEFLVVSDVSLTSHSLGGAECLSRFELFKEARADSDSPAQSSEDASLRKRRAADLVDDDGDLDVPRRHESASWTLTIRHPRQSTMERVGLQAPTPPPIYRLAGHLLARVAQAAERMACRLGFHSGQMIILHGTSQLLHPSHNEKSMCIILKRDEERSRCGRQRLL